MTENEISNKVIGIAIEVHNALGPGLLENTYKECLYYKLVQAGFKVEKEKSTLEQLQEDYVTKFEKEAPIAYKNNEVWLAKKLAE